MTDKNMLTIDKTWSVIQSFLTRNKTVFATNQIESYDSFINDIPKILDSLKNEVLENVHGKKFSIAFTKVNIVTPRDPDTQKLLYPTECLLRGFQYEMSVFVDIIINPGGTYKNFLLMKIPVMVGCSMCNLSPLLKKEDYEKRLAALGEDCNETFGYFIVTPIKDDGTRKGRPLLKRAVVFQERMTYGVPFFSTNKQKKVDKSKYPYSSKLEIRCPYEISSMTITNVGITNDGFLRVDLPWMKDSQFPVLIVLQALGMSKSKFSSLIHEDARDVIFIEKAYQDSFGIDTKDDALEYISRKSGPTSGKTFEEKYKYTLYTLENTFLCHLNNKDQVKNFRRKSYYLCHLIRRKIDHALGLDEDTIRDHFANKRVLTTGTICSQHLHNTLKKLFGRIRKNIRDLKEGENIDLITLFDSTLLSNSWKKAFVKNTWDVTLAKPDGVSQLCDMRNKMSRISDLGKMYLGIGGKEGNAVKVVEPRDYHLSQAMKIDPYDTPESSKVGLLKSLAIGTQITNFKNPTFLLNLIFDMDENITHFDDTKNPEKKSKLFCNGVWVACIDNVERVKKMLKTMRRKLEIEHDITIFSKRDTLHILTDQGRMLRPVFIVENGKLLYDGKKRPFYEYLKLGMIEYIGDMEEDSEETFISPNVNEITLAHTHCELHETFMAGFSTNDSPMFNFNPGARNCYENSMREQAAGFPSFNYRYLYDNGAIILNYPQKALACTRYTQLLKIDETPSEQCFMTLIYAGQYNEEDSVEFNRASIQRGLGVITILKSYCAEITENQIIGIPEEESVDCGEYKYDKLDEDGIIAKGSKVVNGDVLIGVMSTNSKSGQKKYREEFVVYDSDIPGIVDSIQILDSPNGNRIIRVYVFQKRSPEVGDKFSAKHGQKGTIGMIHNQEDMPFNGEGISPDIMINAAAFPSRMTVAMLIELLSGKAVVASSPLHKVSAKKFLRGKVFKKHLLSDGRVDATAFIERDVELYAEELKRHGYERYGNEQFYDGRTGEILKCTCLFGPVSWHRLHHLAFEKNHSRNVGQNTTLFRQPVEGRSQGGGGRLGVQERDCLISNNTPAVLKDGYFERSDPFNILTCTKCGVFLDGTSCPLCS